MYQLHEEILCHQVPNYPKHDWCCKGIPVTAKFTDSIWVGVQEGKSESKPNGEKKWRSGWEGKQKGTNIKPQQVWIQYILTLYMEEANLLLFDLLLWHNFGGFLRLWASSYWSSLLLLFYRTWGKRRVSITGVSFSFLNEGWRSIAKSWFRYILLWVYRL